MIYRSIEYWVLSIVSISIILEIESIWAQYKYACLVVYGICIRMAFLFGSFCEWIKQCAIHWMSVNERQSVADAIQTEHEPVKPRAARNEFWTHIKSWVIFQHSCDFAIMHITPSLLHSKTNVTNVSPCITIWFRQYCRMQKFRITMSVDLNVYCSDEWFPLKWNFEYLALFRLISYAFRIEDKMLWIWKQWPCIKWTLSH